MTFDKMSVWPTGYFRSTTSWLLQARRDVPKRLAVINAEIQRIGFVTVTYRTQSQGDSVMATEERVGISVTHGSSLGRLLQAYIAQGGNPFDISPFSHLKGRQIVSVDADGNQTISDTYPNGGVVAPISVNYNDPLPIRGEDTGFGTYRGGYLKTDRYFPPRQGGKMDRGSTDSDIVVRTMQQIRGWANQDIKERLQNIEWRIIKLCDLREQLEKERDEILVQALGGGSVIEVGQLDPVRFNPGLQIQVLIQDMNQILFEMAEDGSVPSYGQPNATLNFLGFTFRDAVSEVARDAMGC